MALVFESSDKGDVIRVYDYHKIHLIGSIFHNEPITGHTVFKPYQLRATLTKADLDGIIARM